MRVVAVPIFLVAMCLMVLLPTEVVAYILLCVGGPAPLQVAPAFSEVSAGLAHVSNRIGRLLRSLAPHAIFVASTSEVLQVIAIEFTVLEASSCLRSFCIVAETLSVIWLLAQVWVFLHLLSIALLIRVCHALLILRRGWSQCSILSISASSF